ncbi:hypothetical protein [Clostridium botulinum]|uniref:hypothetical protein n=1 Tax=Clostridium botulinum TaxID=1491 RepID=UPI001C9A327B|nr:hypothetical protein [Clostridium botulinum]MBY6838749.1 hypothetical protein [Clostridium botulinum]
MYYKFNIKNEQFRVWMWKDDFHNTITIEDNKTHKQYDRTIRSDNKGRFFTWNKEKVYVNDYHKITFEEFNNKLIKNEWIISDELTQMILNEGIENVIITAPMNKVDKVVSQLGIVLSNGNEYSNVDCLIKEYQYKVKDNYKINLVPLSQNYVARSFYTSDLLNMIKEGRVKIKLKK